MYKQPDTIIPPTLHNFHFRALCGTQQERVSGQHTGVSRWEDLGQHLSLYVTEMFKIWSTSLFVPYLPYYFIGKLHQTNQQLLHNSQQ